MVVVDLAVQTLIKAGFIDCHIILQSDNLVVVSTLSAGYSWSAQQNFILYHIVDCFQTHQFIGHCIVGMN